MGIPSLNISSSPQKLLSCQCWGGSTLDFALPLGLTSSMGRLPLKSQVPPHGPRMQRSQAQHEALTGDIVLLSGLPCPVLGHPSVPTFQLFLHTLTSGAVGDPIGNH